MEEWAWNKVVPKRVHCKRKVSAHGILGAAARDIHERRSAQLVGEISTASLGFFLMLLLNLL